MSCSNRYRLSTDPLPKRLFRPLPQGLYRSGPKKGQRKKTTNCTPLEILGRIEAIIRRNPLISVAAEVRADKYDEIEELLTEWRHS